MLFYQRNLGCFTEKRLMASSILTFPGPDEQSNNDRAEYISDSWSTPDAIDPIAANP